MEIYIIIAVLAVILGIWIRYRTKRSIPELHLEELARLRFVTEQWHDGLVWVRADGEIEWINSSFASLTGYTLEEIQGKNVYGLLGISTKKKDGVAETWSEDELPIAVKDGKIITVAIDCLPVNRAGDRTLLIVKDISAQVELEDDLKRAHHALDMKIRRRTTELAHANEELCNEIAERRRAEAVLKESEERFRQMAEHIQEAIWMTDAETNQMLYVSPVHEKIWGLSCKELFDSTDSWINTIHPDDRDRVVAAALKDQATGAYDEEYRIVRPDGSIRWIRDRAFPVLNERGQVYRIAGLAEDITTRKLAEEALGNQANRLRRIIETQQEVATAGVELEVLFGVIVERTKDLTSAEGCWIETLEGNQLQCRAGVGVGADKILEKQAVTESPFLRVLDTGMSMRCDNAHAYVEDGKELYGRLIRSGEISSIIAVPLHLNRETCGVIVIVHREQNAFDDLELSTVQLMASLTSAAMGQAAQVEAKQQLLQERINSELALRRANDELETRVQQRTKALANTNRALKQEIGERRKAEAALLEVNRRLQNTLAELNATQQQVIQQERLRALGKMASGIAHDFNNALIPIMGYSNLLLDQQEIFDDKDTLRQYIETMLTAAQDAASVVKRLREFYRPREEGEVFLPVNLKEVIEQAISLTQPRWKDQALANGRNIEIRSDLRDVPPIACNAAELREVVTNLVFNSVDAMPEGGTISLRAFAEGEWAIVEVQDTGIGMTEEVKKRCMEPFITTKGDHGTGLGLAMVYGIVHRHGGNISIESEIGSGTTFRISLPIQQQLVEAVVESENKLWRSLRVLVVDDEPLARDVISKYFIADGHTVDVASDGHEALQKVERNEFDLLVTDHAMPRMNGEQLASAVKAKDSSLPIILLTGFGNLMLASGVKPPGIDLIVSKPVTLAELREATQKVVMA